MEKADPEIRKKFLKILLTGFNSIFSVMGGSFQIKSTLGLHRDAGDSNLMRECLSYAGGVSTKLDHGGIIYAPLNGIRPVATALKFRGKNGSYELRNWNWAVVTNWMGSRYK